MGQLPIRHRQPVDRLGSAGDGGLRHQRRHRHRRNLPVVVLALLGVGEIVGVFAKFVLEAAQLDVPGTTVGLADLGLSPARVG